MDLKSKIDSLPQVPGVYMMKDSSGSILYIGKAKSLKNRVSSYFLPSADHEPKIKAMVEQVCDIDILETASEIEALLLESRLIKDIQPKYNTQLKDSKSFPFLAISKKDDFPKVLVGRDNEFDPKIFKRYGPFLDPRGLRQAVKILRNIFKFRTCKIELSASSRKARRPCILYSINQCSAPCAGKIDKEAYKEEIDALRHFLEGKRIAIIKKLEKAMKKASSTLDFEQAAQLRDKIKALESLDKQGEYGDFIPGGLLHINAETALEELAKELKLEVIPKTIEGVDIAHFAGKESVGSIVTFVDGVPYKAGYRRYRIKNAKGSDDYSMIREVIGRRFKRLMSEGEKFPDILLIDGGKGQLSSVLEEFKILRISHPHIIALAKKREEMFIEGRGTPLILPKNSIALHLLCSVRDEAHRFARVYHHILRRKSILDK